MENKYLCFINFIGEDLDNVFTYEFLFTDKIDTFWGENFEYFPSCLCNELIPDKDSYDVVKVVKTKIKLDLIQKSCCFSMQDAIDGIVAIGYENISDYEEYPDDGRLIFFYGDSYLDTEFKLANKNILFEDKK